MHAGDSTLITGNAVHSDESFQRLLLQFSDAAAVDHDENLLIQIFCRETRLFFQTSGVYFWRCVSVDELVGSQADGFKASEFNGFQLKASGSAVAVDCVRTRHTLYLNDLEPGRFPVAEVFHARAILAAPLVVAGEVVGAITLIHDAVPDFFNDDLAAKATIVAAHLGSLLEAARLTRVAKQEERRAQILAEVAHALHGVPDIAAVIEALGDRLRVLLNTRLVCVLLREDGPFELRAVAAESAALSQAVQSRRERGGLRFASDLATRAIAAGEPITVAMDASVHALEGLVPTGRMIVAPLRTASTQGAILVYPRVENAFTTEEKSLVSAVAGFGEVAMANADLYARARDQAHELHQLLEISSELSSMGKLDEFLEAFVVRAADFLGFGRGFVGLVKDGAFHVRWGAEQGEPRRVEHIFPEGVATRALKNREVFWTNDARKVPGANLDVISRFEVKQALALPLMGATGEVLGMLGVLDKCDQRPISPEDIRRARALAAQVAVVLEVTHNLHRSEQHRHRAEALMDLAHESSTLHLAEFARKFTVRAAEMMEAQGGALACYEDGRLRTLVLEDSSGVLREDAPLLRAFSYAVARSLESQPNGLISGGAADLLGPTLAASLGWKSLTMTRLSGHSGEPAGLLCLANRNPTLTLEDEHLLQAIAGHASVALNNARLFTRMDQANRHWMDIFDAITDLIVVHDESNVVLRVNRSLADFIGVQPPELVGLNMRAILSLGSVAPAHACPFCRGSEDADEYVHQVLERTYLVSTSRIHGATTESLQTIHVLKDITDRREAERRYRELFDNIQEGLFFSTPGGRFIEVNDAMVRLLGYGSREELLQVDIPSQVYFSPAERQRLTNLMLADGILRNQEETLRRKDGSMIHVLINAFAVTDVQGKVVQYRGLMLDITGLKNFQAELQRERDFSSKILNNTQSLILVSDTAGLISYANRRWCDLGYDERQLLGRPLTDLVPPPRRQSFSDALSATIAGQQVDNLDLHVVRGDGRVGQFSVNLSPMRDEAGMVTSIIVVMTDITDSALLQSKLMHAEKMAAVGQLVSGVAHEVNNPLTAILGFTDLLMENRELPDTVRNDLRVILQEAQRTKQIVQNLLSFARQMPPQRKAVQLNAILRRTVQLRAYDFNSHGVEVIEHLDETLPQVVGDAHQLQQVFLNILNNAYDAVHDIGRAARIEIATTVSGGSAEVSFRDNGQGISSPDRIFDPFFTTKEVGKGTGLGLSICYGIVREHGGEILCHNNCDAPGATFTVRLPALADGLSAAAGGLNS
jgi:two-component system NtrC family sensor kinase